MKNQHVWQLMSPTILGVVAAILMAAGILNALAENRPTVQLRVVDQQLQMGTDSEMPYYIQWCAPGAPWQTWNDNSAFSAAQKPVWLRGVFQPGEATSWDLPSDATQILLPNGPDVIRKDGKAWSTIGVRQPDGSVSGLAPTFFADAPAGDLPAGAASRANLIWFNPGNRNIAEWILNTTGATQATFAVGAAAAGYTPAGMGDINGDHISDIFLYNTNLNKVIVWFLNADGTYSSNVMVNGGQSMTAGWLLRAIGDIDGNQTADIVWHSSVSRMVAYWLINPDGTLSSYGFCTNTPMSAGWSLDASGDINGDNTMDLIWHNATTRRVAYWLLNPDGTLNTAGFCTTNTMAAGWQIRGAGDIKGDGTIGILWHNANTKQVAYWLLGTNGLLTGSGLCFGGTMSGGWELDATPDIDRDGRIDVAWFNTSTRKAAYWLLATNGTLAASGFCTTNAVANGYGLYGAGGCLPPGEENVWTEVIGLPSASYAGGADTLGSYVYYVGGNKVNVITNVYRFSGTSWTEVKGLPSARGGHTVCTYAGDLYAIGGFNVASQFTTNVFKFDGANWTEVAGIPQTVVGASSAVLGDRLYVIGGFSDIGVYTNVLAYDGTNWTEVAGLPGERYAQGVATLGGYIYAAGGVLNDYVTMVTNVYRFDGANWTEVAGMPVRNRNFTLTAVNGALYAAGGLDDVVKTNAYMFTGSSWTEVAGMPQPRRSHAAAALGGYLYVMGGEESGEVTNVYRYQPESIVADEGESTLPTFAAEPVDGGGASDWTADGLDTPDYSLSGVSEFGGSFAGDPVPAGAATRANLIWYNTANRNIAEWILNTTGATQATFAVGDDAAGYTPAGMGDVEGDGVSDIILYNTNLNKVMVWFLDNEGQYRTNLLVNGGLPMTSGWLLRAIGDIDTDGRVDLVWHSSVTRKVAYWILNTDGTLMTYGLCTNTPMSAGWSLDASGDINGDNTMDLIWHNATTRRVAYWLLNPDGTLNTAGFCTTNTMAAGWQIRGAGDIKGDGTIGILWHNANTKQVAYWLLGTSGLLTGSGLCFGGTMSGGWELDATPDIDRDGRIDVAWFNTSTRKAAYWLLATNGTLAASGFCTTNAVASGYGLYGAGYCRPVPPGSWTAVDGLPIGSSYGAAAKYNGAIYYTGGFKGDRPSTNVYAYNGADWAETRGLPFSNRSHAACSYDGYLYTIGGGYHGMTATNVCRFDGASWTEVAGLPSPMIFLAAATLQDRMYALYDTSACNYNGTSWTSVTGLPEKRDFMGAAELNGALYVVGGRHYDTYVINTNVFRYDGTNWTEVAGLPQARYALSVNALNGYLYAIGGSDTNWHYTTTMYRYNGATWTEAASLPIPLSYHSSAVLNGSIYVMGGSPELTNVYRYTP